MQEAAYKQNLIEGVGPPPTNQGPYVHTAPYRCVPLARSSSSASVTAHEAEHFASTQWCPSHAARSGGTYTVSRSPLPLVLRRLAVSGAGEAGARGGAAGGATLATGAAGVGGRGGASSAGFVGSLGSPIVPANPAALPAFDGVPMVLRCSVPVCT